MDCGIGMANLIYKQINARQLHLMQITCRRDESNHGRQEFAINRLMKKAIILLELPKPTAH